MQVFALPNHGESGKIKLALPKSGRWLVPRRFSFGKFPEGHKLFVPLRKGGSAMVTYGELFQFCLVIIGVISICLTFAGKKK